MSGMASIGRNELVELERGLCWETRDGTGGRVSLPDHQDQGTTDPGGSRRGRPAWQLPVGSETGPGWASSMQAFLPLGSQPAEMHGQDNRKLSVLAKSVLGGRSLLSGWAGGSSSVVPPPPPQCPEIGNIGGGCGLQEGIGGLHRK